MSQTQFATYTIGDVKYNTDKKVEGTQLQIPCACAQ